MRNILIILFLLGFCANQLHIIDPIVKYFKKSHFNNNFDFSDDSAAEEGDETEKKKTEKEVDEFFVMDYAGHLGNVLFIHPKCDICFLDFLYINPFAQKDIKPPRFS